MFMEKAVDLANEHATKVIDKLPEAIKLAVRRLHDIGFPNWWKNLDARGQDAYRRLLLEPAAVPRSRWVKQFGNDPEKWLKVLATTGVAALHDDWVLARGTHFRHWVEANQQIETNTDPLDVDLLQVWFDQLGAGDFERLVIHSLAKWARTRIEFPAGVLQNKEKFRGDNNDLVPEAYFQINALTALLQHEDRISAEPEALSMTAQGRSDIKVRDKSCPSRRACVEFKIFGRTGHATMVKQVIDYAAPEDSFAAVVCIDRAKDSLREKYEQKCFDEATDLRKNDAPNGLLHPAFLTIHPHPVNSSANLRVWHFLLQFRIT
jgi:hypothetical protein